MRIIALFFVLIAASGSVFAEGQTNEIRLKPNSTYVMISDVNLAEETVTDGTTKNNGIAFYTTNPFDSHEGKGWLHLDESGVYFKQGKEKICGWDKPQKKLEGCPNDLPIFVAPQTSGKITLYLLIEEIEKKRTSEEAIQRVPRNEITHFIMSFRGEELFLDPDHLATVQKANKKAVWREVKTGENGVITK
jgi:hypothetical protein